MKEYRVTIKVDDEKVKSEGIYDPEDPDYSFEDTIKEELEMALRSESRMGIVIEDVMYDDYPDENHPAEPDHLKGGFNTMKKLDDN